MKFQNKLLNSSTALHKAVILNNIEIVKLFLKNDKTDIKIKNAISCFLILI